LILFCCSNLELSNSEYLENKLKSHQIKKDADVAKIIKIK
jgi:hypothetical protein